MQRRRFLKLLAVSTGGISAATRSAAATHKLKKGRWYDGVIDRTIDADTFDIYVKREKTTYNVRTLGHDSPEKSGNTRFEKTEE
jgi:endonuclease YncB( thermonuclease family)